MRVLEPPPQYIEVTPKTLKSYYKFFGKRKPGQKVRFAEYQKKNTIADGITRMMDRYLAASITADAINGNLIEFKPRGEVKIGNMHFNEDKNQIRMTVNIPKDISITTGFNFEP